MSVLTSSISTDDLRAVATTAVDAFITDHHGLVDTAVWYATTSNEGDHSPLPLEAVRTLLSVQAARVREGQPVTLTYFQGFQARVNRAETDILAHVYSQEDLDYFASEWMSAQDDRDAAVRIVRADAAQAIMYAISASL